VNPQSPEASASTGRALLGRKGELVAVAVLEDGRRAPLLLLRRLEEFNAAGLQLLVSLLDVVAVKGDVREGTDAILLAFWGVESEERVRTWHAELDPALLPVEGLVGKDGEAEFFGIEVERLVLIAN